MPPEDPRRTLERLGQSQDFLGGSAPRPASEATDDPVEVWARRCGRGLAIVGSIALVAWALADASGGGAK